ncbi:unnamed protein product [Phytomonas sp. EM1]|nr:unnamed protein product [Phytomonas sp. EM1]|eukprot:CCW61649.1 unnamed protein product [Phytomonas sp. isolate EM1]
MVNDDDDDDHGNRGSPAEGRVERGETHVGGQKRPRAESTASSSPGSTSPSTSSPSAGDSSSESSAEESSSSSSEEEVEEDPTGSDDDDDGDHTMGGRFFMLSPPVMPQWLALMGGSIVSELPVSDLATMRITAEEVNASQGTILRWKAAL